MANNGNNISPIDGRYRDKTEELAKYFSENALIKERIWVEIEYLLRLVKFLEIVMDRQAEKKLKGWTESIGDKELLRVKEIEAKTNHDVKAVEYLIREKLKKENLTKFEAWVHWGLTSEDVNNLCFARLLTRANTQVLLPLAEKLMKQVVEMADKEAGTVMVGRTHGQPAVPTTMGKELVVVAHKLEYWLKKVRGTKLSGKITGAVGNLNGYYWVYPKKDWLKFSRETVEGMGLEAEMITTQVEPGLKLSEWLWCWLQFDRVLEGFCRDMWWYIALGYWKQRAVKGEVGSSTMPQKVNPIQFENAEGNLQMAEAILELMTKKFMVTRLQRDLSDTTVKKNLGVVFGHTLVAMKNILAGLARLTSDKKTMLAEVKKHPEMLAEAEQLLAKSQGVAGSYESVKEKTRGKSGAKMMGKVEDYVGIAALLTKQEIRRINHG